jgi:type III secretion system YscQ/HrcQ family protein
MRSMNPDLMSTRAFELATLPRVARADFAMARRMSRRFGDAPRHVRITVAPFGRLSLTFSYVGPSLPPSETATLWSLRRGGHAGWLSVEGMGGLRVVAAMLGTASPRVHRRLRTTETGLLAAAISAVCRVALPGALLNSAQSAEWSGAGLARVCLHLDSSTFRQEVFLDLPPQVVPPFFPDHLQTEMLRCHLEVPLTCEVARTLVSAAEWSSAGPGDAVVFAPHPSKSLFDETPAQLVCGSFSALVAIGKANTVRIIRLFTPIAVHERNTMSDETVRNHSEAVIAGAPIEIVAECGRITLPADELMSLRPGAILPLGSAGPTEIQLRVNGRLWARGEVVVVDGHLGVRVLSLAHHRNTQ